MIAKAIGQLLGVIRSGLRALIPIALLLGYTILGAYMFYHIEGDNERANLKALKHERIDLLEETVRQSCMFIVVVNPATLVLVICYRFSYDLLFICENVCDRPVDRDMQTAYEMNNVRGMAPLLAYNYTVHVLERYRERLGVSEVDVDGGMWTWWGAVFFTWTVYTTIGYGNIYPVTTLGRVATIIYAFLGIPLALISLIGVGSLFAGICKIVWTIILESLMTSTGIVSKRLRKQFERLSKVTSGKRKQSDDDDDLLSFPVSFLIGITFLWVLVCAGIFLWIEDHWDYGTSLYFTLISFTTIGFGDVFPSKPDYTPFVGICILIGLAQVSTVLTIIQQQMEALASGLDSDIDKQYNAALTATYEEGGTQKKGKDVRFAIAESNTPQDTSPLIGDESPQHLQSQLDAVVARMSLKNRLLYYAMSDRRRQRLTKKAEERMNFRVVGTQTDAYLLQTLIEEHLRRVDFQPPCFENVNEFCNLVFLYGMICFTMVGICCESEYSRSIQYERAKPDRRIAESDIAAK